MIVNSKQIIVLTNLLEYLRRGDLLFSIFTLSSLRVAIMIISFPLVAIAVVWNMLFHPTMGPINQFLKLFIENFA